MNQLDFVDGGHHATDLLGQSLTSNVWGGQPETVTQDFGAYNPATAGMYGYAAQEGWPAGTHVGIDIGVPEGTPIYAAEDGTVTESHKDGSIAPYFRPRPVEITTATGYLDIYGHLGQDAVDVGQQVHAGQLLGWSDQQTYPGTMVPDGTGPHLHFERRDPSGTADNPVPTLLANVGGLIPPIPFPGIGSIAGGAGAVASDALGSLLAPLIAPLKAFAARLGLFVLGVLLLGAGIAYLNRDRIGRAMTAAV